MISVPLGESDLRGYLTERVSLAAVNAPTLCVLAGPVEDIAEVERKLCLLMCIRDRPNRSSAGSPPPCPLWSSTRRPSRSCPT